MPIESEIAPATPRAPSDGRVPAPTSSGTATKRRWMSLARVVIIVAVVVGLWMATERSIAHWNSQPEENRLRLNDLHAGWLAVGAVAYAASLLPAVFVLSRALQSLGVESRLRPVVAAQLIGHLAKYVPGKAMVIFVRADVLNRGGAKVSIRAATIAISIETLTMIATGATIAVGMLMFTEQSTSALPSWIRQTSLLMALAAIVATLPSVLKLVLSRRMLGGALSFQWTGIDVLAAWFWNGIAWVLIGLSTTALVLAVPEHIRSGLDLSSWSIFATCLTAIALAYVAGFLSLLPGGAGVRELALTAMLSPIAEPSGAFLIAIIMRMMQLVVEGILAGAAWLTCQSAAPQTNDVDLSGTSD
jgi:glycosyltransferase 2 family protein